MRQEFLDLIIKTNGQNLYEFTFKTIDWIKEKKLKNGILNLSAGDYLELFAYLDVNSIANAYISNDVNGLRGNHFSAFKLII